MDITAIICEYNPFHKGHKYQIDKIKELYPETRTVSIMSPSFVQRGEPAVFDKFIRGECAVRCGIDLAVSMPQVFALQSAEGFAEVGIKIAKALGATALAFGIENGNIETMMEIAKLLISDEFEQSIKELLSDSPFLSYAQVRQKTLEKYVGAEKASLISTPNNILAVEYIKASLRHFPELEFRPIKRIGNGYNNNSTEGEFLSASAIRSIISNSGSWCNSVPEGIYNILNNANAINYDKYNNMLYSVLTVANHDIISGFAKNKELADILYSSIKENGDFKSFRLSISRRKFPQTKIDRLLTCMLLNIRQEEFEHTTPEYVALLGVNTLGREVLKNADIEIISKFNNMSKISSQQARAELIADRIWARCCNSPQGEKYFIDKKPFIAEDII